MVKPNRLSESHDCKKEKICMPTKSWAAHRQAIEECRSARKSERKPRIARANRTRERTACMPLVMNSQSSNGPKPIRTSSLRMPLNDATVLPRNSCEKTRTGLW